MEELCLRAPLHFSGRLQESPHEKPKNLSVTHVQFPQLLISMGKNSCPLNPKSSFSVGRQTKPSFCSAATLQAERGGQGSPLLSGSWCFPGLNPPQRGPGSGPRPPSTYFPTIRKMMLQGSSAEPPRGFSNNTQPRSPLPERDRRLPATGPARPHRPAPRHEGKGHVPVAPGRVPPLAPAAAPTAAHAAASGYRPREGRRAAVSRRPGRGSRRPGAGPGPAAASRAPRAAPRPAAPPAGPSRSPNAARCGGGGGGGSRGPLRPALRGGQARPASPPGPTAAAAAAQDGDSEPHCSDAGSARAPSAPHPEAPGGAPAPSAGHVVGGSGGPGPAPGGGGGGWGRWGSRCPRGPFRPVPPLSGCPFLPAAAAVRRTRPVPAVPARCVRVLLRRRSLSLAGKRQAGAGSLPAPRCRCVPPQGRAPGPCLPPGAVPSRPCSLRPAGAGGCGLGAGGGGSEAARPSRLGRGRALLDARAESAGRSGAPSGAPRQLPRLLGESGGDSGAPPRSSSSPSEEAPQCCRDPLSAYRSRRVILPRWGRPVPGCAGFPRG